MKIKHVAAAAITPTAIAGVAVPLAVLSGPAAPHHAAHTHRLARHASHVAHSRPVTHPSPTAKAGAATVTVRHAAPVRPQHHQPAAVHRAQAQPAAAHPVSAQPGQAAAPAADSLASVTVYGSPFEKCVAYRESTDTPTDPDGLFGILPSTWASLGYSGTAGQAPISLQVAAFNRLYAEYGAQPWAPSDGC